MMTPTLTTLGRALAAVIALGAGAAPLHAATIYTDRASFEAAVRGTDLFVEDFNSTPVTRLRHDEFIYPLAHGLSIFAYGPGGGVVATVGAPGTGALPTPGIQTSFFENATNTPATYLAFIFASQTVVGFGFDYMNADFPRSVWIGSASAEPLTAPASPGSDTSSFIGILADEDITVFALSTDASDRDYFVDNFTFAHRRVPEPAAPAILAFATAAAIRPPSLTPSPVMGGKNESRTRPPDSRSQKDDPGRSPCPSPSARPSGRSRRSDTNWPTCRPAFRPAWLSNDQWMPA